MDEDRKEKMTLLLASIVAPLIYIALYFLDNLCTNLPSDNISKICQLYANNNIANSLMTFSRQLSHTVMPTLFISYLIIALIFNLLLLRHYAHLTNYPQHLTFLPRNGRLFRIFSGTFLGLGIIFSIISITATTVIIYMGIIFSAFWIKSSPRHPIDVNALTISSTVIAIGMCLLALVPVLTILPYRSLYKEYDAYLNAYHPKDTKNSFRTGVLIAILLICLDAFLRQFG